MQIWECMAVVLIALTTAPRAETRPPYRQITNIVYAETQGVGLLMDVFEPVRHRGPGHGIGIVCVTSGGWTSDRGMVDAHRKVGIFDALCEQGYTVFAVRPGNYTSFTAEQMLAHTRTGIRYVKANAARYHVDPARLGLVGVSAGGHLACLTATRAEDGDPKAKDLPGRFDTRVVAVGAFCPATDFLDWGGKKYGLDLMGWRLAFSDGIAGKTEAQKEAAARAISPINYVTPGLPPFLIMHSQKDVLIPYQQSEKFVQALRGAGTQVDLIPRPEGDHSWPTIREDYGRLAQWFNTQYAHH